MIGALAFLFLTYLVAAIPFGLFGDDDDIREAGSGNIGATNVARVYGWGLAGPVLGMDIGKGLVPVGLAAWAWPSWGVAWLGVVGLVAFLGHIYPVYLAFHGGKGVATGAGVMLGIAPLPTLVAVFAWAVVLVFTGRSSLASLLACVALVAASIRLAPEAVPVAALLAVGVIHAHVPNIRRLIAGDEQAIISPVRWGRAQAPESGAALLSRDPAGRVIDGTDVSQEVG